MYRYKILVFALFLSTSIFSQVSWDVLGNSPSVNDFLGSTNNTAMKIKTILPQPIIFSTNNIERLRIGSNGYVGFSTINPLSPVHILAKGSLTVNSFKRAILISNRGSIQFDGDSLRSFFLAHPSSIPAGNFYAGSTTNLSETTPRDYSFTIYVNDNLKTNNPLNTVHFFKNLVIKSATDTSNSISSIANERRLGINTINPKNVLHINTFSNSHIPGSSGLRFEDLRATSTPLDTNPGPGVLTVDGNGDVIYVKANLSQSNTFQPCSNSAVNHAITSSSSLNFNDFNLYMEDYINNQNINRNSLGIGYNCGQFLPAKLSVCQNLVSPTVSNSSSISAINRDVALQDHLIFTGIESRVEGVQNFSDVVNRGGYFLASNANETIGVKAHIPNFSLSNSNLPLKSVGGQFIVDVYGREVLGVETRLESISKLIIGVKSESIGMGNNTFDYFNPFGNAANIGVLSYASGSYSKNIGGRFYAGSTAMTSTSDPHIDNIGVLGIAANGVSSIGVLGMSFGSWGQSYAGYFQGNVYINGISSASNYNTLSDERIKIKIKDVFEASMILDRVEVKEFFYDTLNTFGLSLSSKKQFGVIAQQIKNISPNLVNEVSSISITDTLILSSKKLLSVNYDGFIPLLIRGHQEQGEIIDSLSKRVEELLLKITKINNYIESISNANIECDINQIKNDNSIFRDTSTQSETSKIVLEQNIPNPFNDITEIRFVIPELAKDASMVFQDLTGKIVMDVKISDRGSGLLKVRSSNFSNSIYTYSLFIDGVMYLSKKLIKE